MVQQGVGGCTLGLANLCMEKGPSDWEDDESEQRPKKNEDDRGRKRGSSHASTSELRPALKEETNAWR